MDVLVLNYNDSKTTISFLEYMREYKSVQKILVVDNCSSDDSFIELRKYSDDKIEVVKTDRNGGYGYGNNFGIRYLEKNGCSDYVLLANPDTFIEENVLTKMEAFLADNPAYAMVAPFMCNLKQEKQVNTAFKVSSLFKLMMSICAFTTKVTGGFYYRHILQNNSQVLDVEALSGSLFMMNLKHMLDAGMFDENIFLFCEEIVLGKKLFQQNMKMALLPQMTFIHHHSVSISKSYSSIRSRNKLLQQSREYVLRNYYQANSMIVFLSRILSNINMIEWYLSNAIKSMKANKKQSK